MLPVFLFAQKPKPLNLRRYDEIKFHFGMAMGFNQMRADIHRSDNFHQLDSMYSVEANPQMGFNINIVSNWNINPYFSLRFLPGLNFGQRNMEYVYLHGQKFHKKEMEIESTYLDFPLLFQVKSARMNNFRMYLVGGFSYKFDLSSQKEISKEDKPRIRFKPHVFSYEIGVGSDFFLEYFKFALEVRYTFGINNVVHYDDSQFSRVRVRALLPQLAAQLERDVAVSLARTADLARADADLLDELAEVGSVTSGALPVSQLRDRPDALRWRILQAWLRAHGAEVALRHVLAVDQLVCQWRGQGRIAIPGGHIERHQGELVFHSR